MDSGSRVHPAGDSVKVTFLNSRGGRDRCGYNRERGEAVRSTLPGREVARSGWRALDTPHRPGPVARPRSIPGPPCPALGHPTEAACRPLTENGAPESGGARVLLEAPAPSLVRADRPGAWSRSRRGRAGDVGPAVGRSAIRTSARDVWTPDRAGAVLPALRRASRPECGAGPRCDRAHRSTPQPSTQCTQPTRG
jgi:hypothetical protein